MGPTRRSAGLAVSVVLLGAFATGPEGVPRRVAQALGTGADLCLAVPKPTVQSRLRTTVCHQRDAHLRRDWSPLGRGAGENLNFQTVCSCSRVRGRAPWALACPVAAGTWPTHCPSRRFLGVRGCPTPPSTTWRSLPRAPGHPY